MSILSWNCRGLAVPTTTKELQDLCRTQHPEIAFLVETRAHKARIDRYKRMFRFHNAFSIDPRGSLRRIGVVLVS